MAITKYTDYHEHISSLAKQITEDIKDAFIKEVKEKEVVDYHVFIEEGNKLLNYIDPYISLQEAVDIIDNTSYEFNDEALLEGMGHKEALVVEAFHTLKHDLIEGIGSYLSEELNDYLDNEEEKIDKEEEALSAMEERFKARGNVDNLEERIRLTKEEIRLRRIFVDNMTESLDSI